MIYIYLLHFRVSKDRIHWIGHIRVHDYVSRIQIRSILIHFLETSDCTDMMSLLWNEFEGETSMKKNYNKIWKSRVFYIYIYTYILRYIPNMNIYNRVNQQDPNVTLSSYLYISLFCMVYIYLRILHSIFIVWLRYILCMHPGNSVAFWNNSKVLIW